ncbi:DNA-processing protein DprA [Candidatus Dependentiae bacterium]|nr:DNA-processing protein DprA [Candidatus Dependentiae bacterium]
MVIQEILLHLNLIEDIGPATILKILNACKNQELHLLYRMNANDLKEYFKCSDFIAGKIVQGLCDKKILEQELELIKKNNIQVSTICDETYPELLRHINYPPIILYIKGQSLEVFKKNIAIVGARKANFYGQRVVNQIVPDLVKNDFTIVSGGAIGLDTMAHSATLAANGKTVAVLGSGLLQPYPSSNKKLFENIVQDGGSIVSSFPLNAGAFPENFPARNRIIAGLSHGCVVVQANIKSGALITAKFALDQAREVFAVPGHIDDELSSGCHWLISQGATLVSSTQDILYAFGILPQKETKLQDQKAEQTSIIDEDSLEHKIIKLCRKAVSFDEILDVAQIDVSNLQNTLFQMQMDGKIEQNFAGLWQAI